MKSNPERDAVVAYIKTKIAQHKERANRPENAGHADELRACSQALGVIAGDIRAGLHLPD